MTRKKQEIEEVKVSSQNKTISLALLESYRGALYEIEKFYRSVNFDSYGDDIELKIKVMTAVLNTGEKLGKNIESLNKLEEKVEKDENLATNRRGGEKTALFEK